MGQVTREVTAVLGARNDAEGPLGQRTRDQIERDDSFRALATACPLQARLLSLFFSYADDALEAISKRGDLEAAQKSVSAMSELFSWLKNSAAPVVDDELAKLF